MNALRLDPSERTFAQLYEPRAVPRFSRKTLLAIGITALVYGAAGYYFVNMKYEMAPFDVPVEGPPIVVDTWLPKKAPPPEPVKEQPLTPRRADNVLPTVDNTLPITPVDTHTDSTAMPVTADAVIPPIVDTIPSQPAVAPPGIIRNPVWISRPTADQVAQLYPTRAIERNVTGSATLLCGVRANGTMTDCQVIAETPGGYQFGRSALAMARYFRISPKTVDGLAVEGFKVRIPVVFSLD